MLDLDKLHEMGRETMNRIYRDRLEPDKILIHIDDLIYEFVRQHAREIEKIRLEK